MVSNGADVNSRPRRVLSPFESNHVGKARAKLRLRRQRLRHQETRTVARSAGAPSRSASMKTRGFNAYVNDCPAEKRDSWG
jgi:hypothetical protein